METNRGAENRVGTATSSTSSSQGAKAVLKALSAINKERAEIDRKLVRLEQTKLAMKLDHADDTVEQLEQVMEVLRQKRFELTEEHDNLRYQRWAEVDQAKQEKASRLYQSLVDGEKARDELVRAAKKERDHANEARARLLEERTLKAWQTVKAKEEDKRADMMAKFAAHRKKAEKAIAFVQGSLGKYADMVDRARERQKRAVQHREEQNSILAERMSVLYKAATSPPPNKKRSGSDGKSANKKKSISSTRGGDRSLLGESMLSAPPQSPLSPLGGASRMDILASPKKHLSFGGGGDESPTVYEGATKDPDHKRRIVEAKHYKEALRADGVARFQKYENLVEGNKETIGDKNLHFHMDVVQAIKDKQKRIAELKSAQQRVMDESATIASNRRLAAYLRSNKDADIRIKKIEEKRKIRAKKVLQSICDEVLSPSGGVPDAPSRKPRRGFEANSHGAVSPSMVHESSIAHESPRGGTPSMGDSTFLTQGGNDSGMFPNI